MFSDLRDLDATAPLVTPTSVDAINFVFFCCVNVAFAAGICVVVTSTVFTVQMRRIVTPAAVSKYLQNARPWTRVAADLFALQVRTPACLETQTLAATRVRPQTPSLLLQHTINFGWMSSCFFVLAQLYTWLGGVVFMGITKQSELELFTGNRSGRCAFVPQRAPVNRCCNPFAFASPSPSASPCPSSCS